VNESGCLLQETGRLAAPGAEQGARPESRALRAAASAVFPRLASVWARRRATATEAVTPCNQRRRDPGHGGPSGPLKLGHPALQTGQARLRSLPEAAP